MSDTDDQCDSKARQLAGLRPWKPGQSGNPAGRQKGTGLTDKLREIVFAEKDGKSVRDALVQVILKAGLKGDYKFIAMIWERLEGRIKTSDSKDDEQLNERNNSSPPSRIEVIHLDGEAETVSEAEQIPTQSPE